MVAKRGFTLIELLVVISIIGMLSSVVLAALDSARAKARDARRLSDVRQIQNALELYATSNNGRYPVTAWVWSTMSQPWIPGLTSQYIPSVPMDPKNQLTIYGGGDPRNVELVYYYVSDGKDYCIQASMETNCSSNPNYVNVWNNSCKIMPRTIQYAQHLTIDDCWDL